MEKEQFEQSNNTLENQVEKFDFEGHEVNFVIDEAGKAKVETPDGLTPEQEAKFKQNVPSLMAALNKKNLDGKKELSEKEQEIELEREKLKLEREKLEVERQRIYSQPAQQSNPVKECFGVETWEDVNELFVSNPAAYHSGMAKYSNLQAVQNVTPKVAEMVTRQTIEASGVNIQEVLSLQSHYGISSLQQAFELHKSINNKPTGEKKNLRASVQAEAVEIMPKGTLNKKQPSEEQKIKEIQQRILSAKG
jgi:hypothetical protein